MATTENTNIVPNTAAQPTSTPSVSSYSSIVEKYGGDANTENINAMYDASKSSQLASLENAYQQNLSDAEYAKSQIDPAYRKSANSLATQYERNRRNLNQQASLNGLNTGTASQQQLALNSNYLRDFGGLRESQANALAESDRNIANMKASYQNQVQQAIADNDFQRAQALVNEYNNSFSRQMQINSIGETEAATKASYGDFSGYEALYGAETAANMKKLWITQNPKLAYQMGVITKAEYNKLTGKGSGGGGGGGSSTGTNSDIYKELVASINAGNFGSTQYDVNSNINRVYNQNKDAFDAAGVSAKDIGNLLGSYGTANTRTTTSDR